MQPTAVLPDDPKIPGLAAIRRQGLARALPAMLLGIGPVDLRLCGYTPGARATLEARIGPRHLAIKAYAEEPAPEAELYQTLGVALPDHAGVRVPHLFLWDRELRVLVIGWLDGLTAEQLVKRGQGTRAGELAARWVTRAAALSVGLGPPVRTEQLLDKVDGWVAVLRAADSGLGSSATALVATLVRTQPVGGTPHLVHGTLYARHVLDLGDNAGVIDWERFGQGPLELDAGIFLSTILRLRLRHEALADDVARAEAAFLAGTSDLLDGRALAWYRALSLLRLSAKPFTRAGVERLRVGGKGDDRAVALSRAHALLHAATRSAGAVA